MTEQTATKVPQIRFKGFERVWEEKRLGEVVIFLDELRKPLKAGARKPGPYPYYGASGIIDYVNGFLFEERLILLSEDGANIVNRSSPICFIAEGKYWVNNHAHVLKANPGFSEFFIRDALERLNFERYNTGTAQPKLNQDVCRNIFVKTAESSEQNKIGKYFRVLDRLIGLHQRKHDKLAMLKKSMLQKMYPRPGTTIPEVRFKGFSGEWKVEPVSSLLVERNIQAPKNDQYPLMAFIAGQGVAPKGERYNREFLVSDEASKKYKQTEFGDFIYSSNNLETGSIGLNKFGRASISPVYSIFSPTQNGDSDFISQLLCQQSFISEMVRWRQGVVYGQWRIHESDFLSIETTFPLADEQKKIGAYFSALDNLISSHATQLQKLKQIKSACLEKMFI